MSTAQQTHPQIWTKTVMQRKYFNAWTLPCCKRDLTDSDTYIKHITDQNQRHFYGKNSSIRLPVEKMEKKRQSVPFTDHLDLKGPTYLDMAMEESVRRPEGLCIGCWISCHLVCSRAQEALNILRWRRTRFLLWHKHTRLLSIRSSSSVWTMEEMGN